MGATATEGTVHVLTADVGSLGKSKHLGTQQTTQSQTARKLSKKRVSFQAQPNEVDQLELWAELLCTDLVETAANVSALHLQSIHADKKDLPQNILDLIVKNNEIKSCFQGIVWFLQPNEAGLGNIYFFKNVEECRLWDGNQYVDIKETSQEGPADALFYQNLDPDPKARSYAAAACGFNTVRIEYANKIEYTFVNLQLFSRSSVFTTNLEHLGYREAAAIRLEQLDSIASCLQGDTYARTAQLLAGAFNVQLDEDTMLESLCKTQHTSLEQDNDRHEIRISRELPDGLSLNLANIDDNKFDFKHQDWLFGLAQGRFVKRFDGELRTSLHKRFTEKNVSFGPTRYYGDAERGKDVFLRTRCPAWADRVVFNEKFGDAAHNDAFCSSSCMYKSLGEGKYIGIAKPVSFSHKVSLRRSWISPGF